MNPITCIFFGRSGSGKGTQAKLLIDFLKEKNPERESLYIETGALFRSFIETHHSYTSRLTKEVLDNGMFLPPFLPVWLWSNILVHELSEEKNLILDGLARKPHEVPILDSAMSFYKRQKPFIVIIDVSRDWSYDRLMSRKRVDDTEERIKNRLDSFEKEVAPSMDFFKNNKSYNVITINGEQSIEEVHKEIIFKINLF